MRCEHFWVITNTIHRWSAWGKNSGYNYWGVAMPSDQSRISVPYHKKDRKRLNLENYRRFGRDSQFIIYYFGIPQKQKYLILLG